ncbi:hypothetical protein COCVIDRAFT_90618 [Bipolaris victoriae FI3]|uniref:Uncharacterized protein n=1 Tax=Bipolaris victoriae (strain FI3) TaxID=930091 RepID=W7F2B5_BIPV3|nr:hypothetical protein COCVIDRAFT_90618 [Bipolaris victoriae FI3]
MPSGAFPIGTKAVDATTLSQHWNLPRQDFTTFTPPPANHHDIESTSRLRQPGRAHSHILLIPT